MGQAGYRHIGIDAGRVIAFFAVVFIHAMGASASDGSSITPETILSFLGRFAVPFYFLSAGYFLVRKVDRPFHAIWGIALRLVPVFVFWALFYRFVYGPGLSGFSGPAEVLKFIGRG